MNDRASNAPADAWVGLGANLGDGAATFRSALDALDALPGTRVIEVSSLWRTAPVDATGDDFLNAVVHLSTALEPHRLLDALQSIETRYGRTRPYRHAPRTLDLDLLMHGTACVRDERLVLPHPRMHERAFVLAPLAELDPSLVVPGHGTTAMLLDRCRAQAVTRVGSTGWRR